MATGGNPAPGMEYRASPASVVSVAGHGQDARDAELRDLVPYPVGGSDCGHRAQPPMGVGRRETHTARRRQATAAALNTMPAAVQAITAGSGAFNILGMAFRGARA